MSLVKNMKGTCSVKVIYEELRRLQAPETELRCKVDTCIAYRFQISLFERQENNLKITQQVKKKNLGLMLDRS